MPDSRAGSGVDLSLWPDIDSVPSRDPAIEARVEDLLGQLSTARKIGQIIQADIASITPEEFGAFALGSVLNGGNSAPDGNQRASVADWLSLADAFWDAAQAAGEPFIPPLWGTDAVHGHSNIAGATIFPHNVGLGAANDPGLMHAIGRATALEIRATGMDWAFAPTLAVAQDLRWGRAYESLSADPDRVARLGTALIRGLQGDPESTDFLGPDHVIACAKHFLGDGGTAHGTDQGETLATQAEMRRVHGTPYLAALEAGLQTVMPSFSSWQGRKMHGRADMLTALLRERLGFDGFTIGDWNGHGQLPGRSAADSPDALLAGLDMYMAPDSWRGLHASLSRQVADGTIPMAALDRAVARVLRVKLRAGLFDQPRPSARAHAGNRDLLGHSGHQALAARAVRQSAVLLKNEGVLPLKPTSTVLLAGPGAEDFAMACGGWTITWQGSFAEPEDFPGCETLPAGLRRVLGPHQGRVTTDPDTPGISAVIYVFGEPPYAEFRGDLQTLDFRPETRTERDEMRTLKALGVPIVSIFLSGRPLWVNPEINASDAFIAAFLPGTQVGALADLLFDTGENPDFTGTLPFDWPSAPDFDPRDATPEPLFSLGHGLRLSDGVSLPQLHENGTSLRAEPTRIFEDGRSPGDWHILIADELGGAPYTPPETRSFGGALRATAFETHRQDDSIRLDFEGTARIVFTRTPADFAREANAQFDFSLVVSPPHTSAPSVQITLSTDSGIVATAELPLTGNSQRVPLKAFGLSREDWSSATEISLSCAAGTSLGLVSLAVVPGESAG